MVCRCAGAVTVAGPAEMKHTLSVPLAGTLADTVSGPDRLAPLTAAAVGNCAPVLIHSNALGS